jgi:acyl-CoA synthetase (AMP-forming)/AMP-acid ligase II
MPCAMLHRMIASEPLSKCVCEVCSQCNAQLVHNNAFMSLVLASTLHLHLVQAGAIAYRLRHEWGAQKGDRVVLCYAPGLHFFSVFFGCLRAGVIAALVYPPDPSNLESSLGKLNKVVANCEPSLVLVDSKVHLLRRTSRLNVLSRARSLWPDLPFKCTDDAATRRCVQPFDELGCLESDVAFLQYTSGSTG